MRKTLFISLLALFLLAFNVSAWHCSDTDARQPSPINNNYGAWGDNGLLNGTTTGWSEDGKRPAGCTGSQGSYVCKDRCDDTTLIEYYCDDMAPYKMWNDNHTKWWWSNTTETVIKFKSYENSNQCGAKEVPEFSPIAAGVAVIGAASLLFVFRKKF